jgi:hypothetical protein
MLYRELLTTELDKQRDDFRRFSESQASDLTDYLHKLNELNQTTRAEIQRKLADKSAGAIPSDELDELRTFSVPFAESWTNHEAARGWANEILKNRTTFAADGSQLYVEKDVSLPIGAIQIGWFENPHDGSQRYEKSAYFEILSPETLLRKQEEPVIPETRVGELRFHAEVNKISEFLLKKKDWQKNDKRMPLAFFDNTLLFTLSLAQTEIEKSFLQATIDMVKLSRDVEVPVVGYVDRSYAKDLLNMLDALYGRENSNRKTLYDSLILHSPSGNFPRILESWGDRTCFCYSKRKGLSEFLYDETGESLVGFTYLQTTRDAAPARIDVPSWIYEKGFLNEVLDVVRAECVIGLGYPYALETADQTAVITMRDREVFLRALQDFAMREKLNFNVSRKAASKNRRR